jgi:nucleoside diphosphate kinase
MENFKVTAMELAQFTRATAMEFYEVYRGIVPDFLAMIFELASGDFIALEIADKYNPCANPVNKFRDHCGPVDPCIARSLRPHTIRSEFGVNKVKNAIHCTDLEEDGELEAQYIFMHEWILDGRNPPALLSKTSCGKKNFESTDASDYSNTSSSGNCSGTSSRSSSCSSSQSDRGNPPPRFPCRAA